MGQLLAGKHPEARLIIGFAETATAVGAAVAGCSEDCIYLTTTRELPPTVVGVSKRSS